MSEIHGVHEVYRLCDLKGDPLCFILANGNLDAVTQIAKFEILHNNEEERIVLIPPNEFGKIGFVL